MLSKKVSVKLSTNEGGEGSLKDDENRIEEFEEKERSIEYGGKQSSKENDKEKYVKRN